MRPRNKTRVKAENGQRTEMFLNHSVGAFLTRNQPTEEEIPMKKLFVFLTSLALVTLPLLLAGPDVALAQGGGNTWAQFTNDNEIKDLAVEGDILWAATDGGVVRWNTSDGTYVKYTTLDGLADNYVHAIAIDGAGNK
ncbi:MAG: hypothetical protein DRG71_06510, partial [Deltaproteobacteria bacterium]